MNNLFNIWHPHLLTSTRLVLDITPAEADLVRVGTKSFVSDCLRTVGVPGSASGWNIITARQSYYSDYTHSPDWRARWDIVWILDVTLSSPGYLPEPVGIVPYKTAAADDSADGYDEPADLNRALLLASFPKRKNIEQEISDTVLNWKAGAGLAIDNPLTWLPQGGGRLLVRGLIDSLKFPDAIDELETLHENWRRAGGVTNWRVLASLI
jgi:hypothetical protein